MNIVVGVPRARRKVKGLWIIAAVVGALLVVVLALLGATFLPSLLAVANYQPQEGDVIFQSLPFSKLVNAIEGATNSPYSHCGIVAKEDGRWVVYEALGPVGPTPLRQFIFRGRNEAFTVKRLRAEHRTLIPAMLTCVRGYRGRLYDEHYRLDDAGESIYCSELIFLAYQTASQRETLGQLTTLGELNWQPYTALIEQIEKAPPPLDRPIITPRKLAQAEQFEQVYSFGYGR